MTRLFLRRVRAVALTALSSFPNCIWERTCLGNSVSPFHDSLPIRRPPRRIRPMANWMPACHWTAPIFSGFSVARWVVAGLLSLMASSALSLCPPLYEQNFDSVTPPVLPAGWTASQGVNVTGAPIWGTSLILPVSPPNDVFSAAPDNILDNRLDAPLILAGEYDWSLGFVHSYDFEEGFDGGVIEISTPDVNGGAFTDISDPAFSTGFSGYNGTISTAFQSPIAGRRAFTGNSNGYHLTTISLGIVLKNYHTPITLRFRLATDNSVSSSGWRIDSFFWNHNECPPPSPPPVPTPTPTPTPCPAFWSLGPNLPTGAARAAGIYFPANGRFYVMGGNSAGTPGSELTHPLEYDPLTATWATKAATFPDIQVNDMACGALTDAGPAIYCVGGSATGATTATSRVLRYNPVTDTIASVAPWPGNLTGDTLPGGCTVRQSKLYLFGGYKINTAMTNQIWEYTPSSNSWLQKNAVLPVPLGYVPVTTIGNLIYTAGGSTFVAPGNLVGSTNVYFYNPAADMINPLPPLPKPITGARAVTVNHQPWVLGGSGPSSDPNSEVNVYDPTTGLWSLGPPLAAGRRDFPAAGDNITGIWLTGGCAMDCAVPLRTTETYQCEPLPPATPSPTPSPSPSPTTTATPTATGTPAPTPTPSTSRLVNISTRLHVETGSNVGIGGFIITGASSLQIVVRALGPSIGLTDSLADPTLEVRDSSGTVLIQNDNWQDNEPQAQYLKKFGLAPTDPAESALIIALPPGTHTPIVSGKNGGTGVGLVEVYDVDESVPPANIELANISTRGIVETGNNVMIGGFILSGDAAYTAIVIRGIGPSLTQFGITNALADPTLELHNSSGALLLMNDNWADDPTSAAQLTAHGLAPQDPLESGIYVSLPPSPYTAILAGKNGGVGVGLVEIYNLGEGALPTPTPCGGPNEPCPTPTATATVTPLGCVENFDGTIAPALPPGWTASNPIEGDGTRWVTSTVMPDTAPNDVFIGDEDGISDKVLETTPFVVGNTGSISFRNNFNTEFSNGNYWDGFVLEVSTPSISGGEFLDITDPLVGGSFTRGGYTGRITTNQGNPLAGRMAWSGDSGGYINTVVNLGPILAGKMIRLRFRMGSDEAVPAPGVRIDSILFFQTGCP